MATTTQRSGRSELETVEAALAQVERWMQQSDESQPGATLHDLKLRVEAYERQFGMRSEDVGAAIDAGLLIEDLDVCNWLMDFDELQLYGGR
ncbi:MAG: hypothetical protein QM692_21575 [Thermomicrobiales bacterium]